MEAALHARHPKVFQYINSTVHVVGAAHFWFACYYDWVYTKVPTTVSPIYGTFANKLVFLTYWNALTSAVFFTVCIVNDIRGHKDDAKRTSTKLNKFKNFFFASIAFPMSLNVGVFFWSLYFVDREFVLPSVMDGYFPPWLNHMMHTNIMIFQFLELATYKTRWPKRRGYVFLALFTFETAYLAWMHVVYYMTGHWVYPVFDVLGTVQRIFLSFGCYMTGFLFCYVGEVLNRFLWDDDRRENLSHPNVNYSV